MKEYFSQHNHEILDTPNATIEKATGFPVESRGNNGGGRQKKKDNVLDAVGLPKKRKKSGVGLKEEGDILFFSDDNSGGEGN